MMPRNPDDVLSRLVREVRSEEIPEVDWDRVGKSLGERLEQAQASAPAKARRSPWGSIAIASSAAAAAVALGAFGVRELSHQQPPQSMVKSAQRWNAEGRVTLDGSRLDVGQRVTAGAAEVRVVHAGLAAWTLAPGSRGMVAFGGELLTVQLERGAVLAEVVPSKRIESFAIEADALRAAAHGTVFHVSRHGDRVQVDVTEGIVAVGPASTRGATRGWLLTAPARGHFSLDGKSGRVESTTPSGAAAAGPLWSEAREPQVSRMTRSLLPRGRSRVRRKQRPSFRKSPAWTQSRPVFRSWFRRSISVSSNTRRRAGTWKSPPIRD
jgi:ferric-dicitrate binding protein FerR (iron transport regulator)